MGRLGLVVLAGAAAVVAACGGDDNVTSLDSGGGTGSDATGVVADTGAPMDSTMPDVAPPKDSSAADVRVDVTVDAPPADVTTTVADAPSDVTVTDADAAPPPPNPALAPDASTVTCPTTLTGSLDTNDPTQLGRYSRTGASSVCGTAKAYPGTAADPTGSHVYDVYRFSNPTASSVCFNFTLTYGTAVAVVDAGADGGDAGDAGDGGANADADLSDAGDDAAGGSDASDAGAPDASEASAPPPFPAKFLAAFSTFYPTSLATTYLGDVGAALNPPPGGGPAPTTGTMGITVPAGGTIDVVVYAVDPLNGNDSYTLSCAKQ